MDTGILFYKIFEKKVVAADYIEWAFFMLQNGRSTTSLNVLVSLRKPLNIFEIEDYFNKARKELNIARPNYLESARYYVRYLLREIVKDSTKAMHNAYDIYNITREHSLEEEHERWYEISEMIDDMLYGDNKNNIMRTDLIEVIVLEAERQLKTTHF